MSVDSLDHGFFILLTFSRFSSKVDKMAPSLFSCSKLVSSLIFLSTS